jgi:lysyl-tRNA synthetase class 1
MLLKASRKMSEEIVGHGTWYDLMAKKVIQREQTLKRDLTRVRTEMGLGASGFPHIGSLGDAARSYAVTLALEELAVAGSPRRMRH